MTLTEEQLAEYADLGGRLRRVVAAGEQVIDGPGEPIHLNGPSPVCGPGEQELGRYGCVIAVKGTFRDEDDDADTLSIGGIAQAAADVLVTDERLVLSMVHGSTRAGDARERQVVVVFDYPWQLVETIETPVKPSMTDRIAGGKPVTVSTISRGMAIVDMIVRSEMSVPPDSKPTGKMKPDDFMRSLVGLGGQWRLRNNPGPDADRLARVIQGEYLREEDSLVAYLVDPEGPLDPSSPAPADELTDEPVAPAAVVPAGGAPAPAPEVAPPPAAPIAAAPRSAEPESAEPLEVRDRFCVACGKPLQENARFCRGCGHQVGAMVESAAP